jgi:hypothetical protein
MLANDRWGLTQRLKGQYYTLGCPTLQPTHILIPHVQWLNHIKHAVMVNINVGLKLIITNLFTKSQHLQPVKQDNGAICHDMMVTTVHKITAQLIISLTECIQTKYLRDPKQYLYKTTVFI